MKLMTNMRVKKNDAVSFLVQKVMQKNISSEKADEGSVDQSAS